MVGTYANASQRVSQEDNNVSRLYMIWRRISKKKVTSMLWKWSQMVTYNQIKNRIESWEHFKLSIFRVLNDKQLFSCSNWNWRPFICLYLNIWLYILFYPKKKKKWFVRSYACCISTVNSLEYSERSTNQELNL